MCHSLGKTPGSTIELGFAYDERVVPSNRSIDDSNVGLRCVCELALQRMLGQESIEELLTAPKSCDFMVTRELLDSIRTHSVSPTSKTLGV